MDAKDKAAIEKAHKHVARLEDQGRWDDADAYVAEHWWIFNHDEKGNWCGPVKNENGWTP
jgi:hypothetical protein